MTARRLAGSVAALLCAAALAGPAQAKLVAEWCEAGKLRAVGGYEACRLAAEASAARTGREADASRCAARLLRRFERAERFGFGFCPSQGDQAAIQGAADAHVEDVASALAGGLSASPAERCLAAKLRAVGAHLSCRFRFHAADVWRGHAAEPDRCDAKLAAKLARAEDRGDGACATEGDAAALQQMDGAHVDAVLDALGGPAPLCGNGIKSAHESCDGSDFGGLDCVQLGYGGGGSLACDEICQIDASSCIAGPPCDLLAQDCPLDGYGCYQFFDRNRCLPEGEAGVDEGCSAATDCQEGLSCVGVYPGAPPKCRAFCDPDASNCPLDRVCTVVGSAGVGYCIESP